MAKAWVHIGWPKTGTTALQYALRHGDFDFVVPQDGRTSDNFEPFVNALGDVNDASHARAMAEYRRCVDTGRDLVISSEHLSGQLGRAEALLSVLHRDYDSVHMVSVVRPFGEWIPSQLTQTSSFPAEVLQGSWKMGLSVRDKMRVHALPRLRTWHDLLPAEQISVMRYDATIRDSIVPQLVELFQGHSATIPASVHNASDSAAFYALRCVALLGLSPQMDVVEMRGLGALTSVAREIRSEKLALSDALLTEIEEQFSDDLDWIRDQYGYELRGARPDGCVVETDDDVRALAASFLLEIRELIGDLGLGITREVNDVVDQVRSWLRFLGAVPELPELPDGFDEQRYLNLHPDLVAAEADPALHYRQHGFFEARAY